MPKHRSRVTAAEWIVVAAIAGVMISAVMPAMQRARQGAGVQRARIARDRGTPTSAGQSNTIRLPGAESGSPTAEQPARRRPPAGGGIAWLAVLAAVTAVIFQFLRRSAARQPHRRRRHPHEGA